MCNEIWQTVSNRPVKANKDRRRKVKSMRQWIRKIKGTFWRRVKLLPFVILKRFMNYPNSYRGRKHDEFTLDWANRSFTSSPLLQTSISDFFFFSFFLRLIFHSLCEWIIEKEFFLREKAHEFLFLLLLDSHEMEQTKAWAEN